MKLSQYARLVGVTYQTAFRWWQAGQIKGYQKPSGTIIVTENSEEESYVAPPEIIVIYGRVSSAEHRDHLDRHIDRLRTYLRYQRLPNQSRSERNRIGCQR